MGITSCNTFLVMPSIINDNVIDHSLYETTPVMTVKVFFSSCLSILSHLFYFNVAILKTKNQISIYVETYFMEFKNYWHCTLPEQSLNKISQIIF